MCGPSKHAQQRTRFLPPSATRYHPRELTLQPPYHHPKGLDFSAGGFDVGANGSGVLYMSGMDNEIIACNTNGQTKAAKVSGLRADRNSIIPTTNEFQ